MAYYITGDCHGKFGKIICFNRFNHMLTQGDVMIILGDVGLNYYGNKTDRKNKRILNEFPNEFLCIHGNHEARPLSIGGYEEKVWRGGIVYYEPEYPRILFANDGEIYDFDGKKAIVLGGAYSVDKEYRLSVGLPWFCDEQPSEEDKQNAKRHLDESGWNVDYVFSHTCPLIYEPTDLFLDFIDQTKVDKSTETWLSSIEKKLKYDKWYFGHFHENREYIDVIMLYEEIRELGKTEFMQRIGRPKYKVGDMVLFYIMEDDIEYECYGRVVIVDELGTLGQEKEVSYDVEGPDYRNGSMKILYKHLEESKLQSLNELKSRI